MSKAPPSQKKLLNKLFLKSKKIKRTILKYPNTFGKIKKTYPLDTLQNGGITLLEVPSITKQFLVKIDFSDAYFSVLL